MSLRSSLFPKAPLWCDTSEPGTTLLLPLQHDARSPCFGRAARGDTSVSHEGCRPRVRRCAGLCRPARLAARQRSACSPGREVRTAAHWLSIIRVGGRHAGQPGGGTGSRPSLSGLLAATAGASWPTSSAEPSLSHLCSSAEAGRPRSLAPMGPALQSSPRCLQQTYPCAAHAQYMSPLLQPSR